MKATLVGIMSLCAFATVAATLPDPIVAWNMDEVRDGKVPDVSGGGCDLALGPGITLEKSDLYGKMLVSDGTVNTWASFDSPGFTSCSFSFWLYRNAKDSDSSILPGENSFPFLLNNMSGISYQFIAGENNARLIIGSAAKSEDYVFKVDGGAREQWKHHVVTVERTGVDSTTGRGVYTVRYYQNAVKVVEKVGFVPSMEIGAPQVGVPFMNNKCDGATKRPVYGRLDEFRLYDVALNDDQVVAEFQRPFKTCPAEEIAHWKFDETYVDTSTGVSMTPEETGLSHALQLGASTILTNGVHGKALWFDGTAGAGAGIVQNGFKLLHDVTLTMWVNIPPEADGLTKLIPDNYYPQLYRFGELGSRAEIQVSPKTNTTVRTLWRNDTLSQNISPYIARRGGWSHLAIVYTHRYNAGDGTWYATPNFYVNGYHAVSGDELALRNARQVFTDPTSGFAIGNQAVNKTRPIMGAVDDVSVWRGALSEERIRALARQPSAVTAETDFSVTTEITKLRATVACGKVNWSQVSGPAQAIFSVVDVPQTDVTMPEEGVYTFRVTVANESGTVETDEVTVTRIAPPTSNLPPVVTLPSSAEATLDSPLAMKAVVTDPDNQPCALRVFWRCTAGPGAVWCEPADTAQTHMTFSAPGTYVLACSASDGAAVNEAMVTVTVANEAGIETGLARYYTADDPRGPEYENVSGLKQMLSADYVNTFYVKGVSGLGFKTVSDGRYFDTGAPLPEVRTSEYPGVDVPSNRYLTVAMWIYYDPTVARAGVTPTLFQVPQTLALTYDSPESVNGTGGFDLFLRGYNAETHAGSSNNDELFCYDGPVDGINNRWAHICVVVDRREGYAHKFYVDGVQQNKATTGSYGFCCGRVVANNLLVGGANTSIWPCTSDGTKDRRRDVLKTGSFAGVVDDVRIYTRDLSASEVARLAAVAPGLRPNRVPQVTATGPSALMKKEPQLFSAIAYDDGLPLGSTLTYAWEVLAGPSEAVVFSDSHAATTSVRVNQAGNYSLRVSVSDGELVGYSDPMPVRVDQRGTIVILR